VSTAQYIHAIRDLNEGRDVIDRPSALAIALSIVGTAMAFYLLIR
jgi:hypothetical protein